MALPPDEPLSKDKTVLIMYVYIVFQAHVCMNISHPS